MWGIVAAIAGTAIGLALLETALSRLSDKGDKTTPSDRKQLSQSEPGFKNKPNGTFKAPIWQELTAKEIIDKARQWGSRAKK